MAEEILALSDAIVIAQRARVENFHVRPLWDINESIVKRLETRLNELISELRGV